MLLTALPLLVTAPGTLATGHASCPLGRAIRLARTLWRVTLEAHCYEQIVVVPSQVCAVCMHVG